jgi:hypothetical protein
LHLTYYKKSVSFRRTKYISWNWKQYYGQQEFQRRTRIKKMSDVKLVSYCRTNKHISVSFQVSDGFVSDVRQSVVCWM